jgi:hypothetical protein
LAGGSVTEGKAEVGGASQWKKAPSIGRDAAEEVLEAVVDDYLWSGSFATGAPASTGATDEQAFKAMVQKNGDWCSGGEDGAPESGELDSKGRPRLARGVIADGPLEELGLPPQGFKPVLVTDLCDEVNFYMKNFRRYMLRPSKKIPWAEMDQVRSYWSPTYKTQSAKLQLALALYLSGMLGFCPVFISPVTLFTVVKGYTP